MSNIYANNINPRSGSTVTFPQNIKVLGTATYEDVANVDSVGIITAQSGINISGGDLTAGSQYDRLTVTPGDGIYNSNGTTVTIAGRTNDGNLSAFKVDRYGSGTTADTKVLINYAGRVGIGTDNPVGNLEIRDSKANLIVAKDGLTVKSNSDLATQYDLIQLGAGGALASYSTATTTADTQLIHNAYRHSGGEWRRRYADTAMRLRMNSPGGAFIFESVATGIADEQITFSEKLRITSDGKIGINNSDPLYAMHFKNAMSSSPSFIHMEVTGTNAVGGGGGIAFDTSASNALSNNSLYLATISGVRNSADDGSNDLVFKTSKSNVAGDDGNTHSPKERLRITSDGDILPGGNKTQDLGSSSNSFANVYAGNIELSDDYPAIKPALSLNFAGARALDSCITFTRNSVGTYVGRDGLIKTAGADEPRFDHDPVTLESLGLLIEESRTNMVQYSNSGSGLNDAPYYGNWNAAPYTDNFAVAPDGTTTAWKMTPTSPSASRQRTVSVTAGNTYTFSVWLKKDPSVSVSDGVWDYLKYLITWNTSPIGATTQQLVSGSTTSAELTTEWRRFSVSYTAPSGATTMQFGLSNANSGSGNPGYSVFVWGAQIELGSFVTSHIPTSGSEVTRAADTPKITGTSFSDFYNPTEGTLLSFSRTLGVDLYETATFEFTSSNSNAERIALNVTNSYNRFYLYGGGDSASSYNSSVVAAGTLTKNALAYKLNDVAAVRDGGTVLNDTSAGIPIPNIDRATIGYNIIYGNQKQQHIDRILYYPKRLTDAQLQLLTS